MLEHSGVYVEAGASGHQFCPTLEGLRATLSPNRKAATSLIKDELLVDFPFADNGSMAHAFALLLQPFVRFLITGPTPLYLVTAPARGTGKGLLVDAVTIPVTGGLAGVMVLRGGDDELEKRVTACLVAGHALILLDNVTSLKSRVLSAALTSREWVGRILGRSQMVRVQNDAVWVATGNKVSLSDEMLRRVVPIRLDAAVERPEERTGFKHVLPAWALRHRGKLVDACLSIVEAWESSSSAGPVKTPIPAALPTALRRLQGESQENP